MKAMLSLLLADLPGLPMANDGEIALAASVPAVVERKVLRCMGSPYAISRAIVSTRTPAFNHKREIDFGFQVEGNGITSLAAWHCHA
jgi:hypothetical protein